MISYSKGAVIEPQKQLDVLGEYDVIVAGGGMAGFGAAVAAARAGCRTLLVEKFTALGGLATLGLVNIPLDFVCGIGKEMFDQLKAIDGLWHRNSDPEKHKLVLDRMALAAGCDVLFDAYVVDAIVSGDTVRGVVIECKSGRKAVLAKRVIDCTGDADVAHYAGCEYMQGRAGDKMSQACSLEFRLGGVEWDAYISSEFKKNDPKWIRLIEDARGRGWSGVAKIENHLNWMTHVPGRPQHCGQDEVSICFAHSRRCYPLDTRDLTRMYFEGREQADLLWRFIRENVPGFSRCWLVDTGVLLGVRESRRVLGGYVMTCMDIAGGARFDDVVTISGHGYDIHGPDCVGNIKWAEAQIDGRTRYVIANRSGFGTSWDPPGGKEVLCDWKGRTEDEMQFPAYYDIPYRSLVPVKLDGLLVAGRCLSADFVAQSGLRLVMACLNMGEATGTAAAISLARDIQPRQVGRIELQSKLIENGMNLGQHFRGIPGVTEKLEAQRKFGGCRTD